jgi:hypothetical protein
MAPPQLATRSITALISFGEFLIKCEMACFADTTLISALYWIKL